jgi:hypothetical protein
VEGGICFEGYCRHTSGRGDVPPPEPSKAAPVPPLAPDPLAPFALAGEMSWNGLAGVGPVLGWRPNRNLVLEAGAGLGPLSPKAGLRARYVGGDGRFGFTTGLGLVWQPAIHVDVAEAPLPPWPLLYAVGFGSNDVPTRIGPTGLLQAVVGFSARGGGWETTGLVGWAQVIAGHRVRSETPLDGDQRDWVNGLTGSGPVISVAVGHGLPER